MVRRARYATFQTAGWQCRGSCSRRFWTASSASVCRHRWRSVADTTSGPEAADRRAQRLILRGNDLESLSRRRQGQDCQPDARAEPSNEQESRRQRASSLGCRGLQATIPDQGSMSGKCQHKGVSIGSGACPILHSISTRSYTGPSCQELLLHDMSARDYWIIAFLVFRPLTPAVHGEVLIDSGSVAMSLRLTRSGCISAAISTLRSLRPRRSSPKKSMTSCRRCDRSEGQTPVHPCEACPSSDTCERNE